MQINVNKKLYDVIESFSSFKDASLYAKEHAKLSRKVVTIKLHLDRWHVCIIADIENRKIKTGLIKETEIEEISSDENESFLKVQSKKIISDKDKRIHITGSEQLKMHGDKPASTTTTGFRSPGQYTSIFAGQKIRTTESQTINKITPSIKKEAYIGESFAKRVPCYLCGGNGGYEGRCNKCAGAGWIMEEEELL